MDESEKIVPFPIVHARAEKRIEFTDDQIAEVRLSHGDLACGVLHWNRPNLKWQAKDDHRPRLVGGGLEPFYQDPLIKVHAQIHGDIVTLISESKLKGASGVLGFETLSSVARDGFAGLEAFAELFPRCHQSYSLDGRGFPELMLSYDGKGAFLSFIRSRRSKPYCLRLSPYGTAIDTGDLHYAKRMVEVFFGL